MTAQPTPPARRTPGTPRRYVAPYGPRPVTRPRRSATPPGRWHDAAVAVTLFLALVMAAAMILTPYLMDAGRL